MRYLLLLPALLFGQPLLAAEPRADILIADFEQDDYGEWRTEGTAFGERPARGALPSQMAVHGFEGKQLVNTFHGGDDATGKLTSPTITLERKFLNFLIGGGKWPGETCLNLVIDGKVVCTATGPNDRPGGSEQLDWSAWDVSEFAGKRATLEIVDARKGGWGHVNVDQIVQSDRSRAMQTLTRTMTVDKRYLHLPVKNGAPKKRMRLRVDEKVVREFEIELATEAADFTTFIDLQTFSEKKLVVEVDRLPSDSEALASLKLADDVPTAKELYSEPARPQLHFTSRRGWLNDPNGLVYHDGEWHLFYQHNPYGWDWGNMHWGHAVSKDLFHWRELPIALYPPRWDDFAFSGSAVVDKQNTGNFKSGKEDVLVAAFTSTGRGECIAFSDDRGRSWREFEHNPVVKHAGRDPKLLWHEPTKRWVMAVYDEQAGKQWIAFYVSPDLKKWEFTSRIEGFYECPDLFELPVIGLKGDKLKPQWVLYGADGQYSVGDFDGRTFAAAGPKQTLWYGNFYAAQTYDNAPGDRRVQIGWARGIEFRGMPFNQQMTLPVELSLHKTGGVPRMHAQPVATLEGLHGERREVKQQTLKAESGVFGDAPELACIDTWFVLAPGTEKVGLHVRGVDVVYDAKAKTLRCKNVVAPLELDDNRKLRLQLIVDRGSIEVFANHGQVAISAGHLFADDNRALRPIVAGAAPQLESATVTQLKSAWRD
jgi:fructan beta-fructosidase